MKLDTKKNKKEYARALNFLEDICWLLDSGKNINYSEVFKIISTMKNTAESSLSEQLGQEPDELIGVLPRLLTDITLFDTNKTLAQFSSEVLGIDILNWHKRSRNEMIGVIICKVQESPDIRNGISAFVLSNILKNKEEIKKLQKETEDNDSPFLWNEAIHKIVGGYNEPNS